MSAGADPGGWALAVDVGTSNTTAAVRTADGRVVPVRLSESGFSMPSAVLVDSSGIRVGLDAARRRMSRPGSYEASPKRRLPEHEIQLDGRDCEVVDLVAAVLKHALAQARPVAGGGEPLAIALTHPEPWAPRRRRQLLDAARRAGYDVERTWLVSEPVAAAQSYATRTPVPDGSVVAVFDFGGGTCDVAVMSATPSPAPTAPTGSTGSTEPPRPFTVLASRGLDPLGGSDLDHHLSRWVEQQLVVDGRQDLVDGLADDLRAALTLREEIQAAKHELSRQASATIEVVVGRETHELAITVGEFESLVEADIDRAVQLTRATLTAASVEADDVQALYLTGGSSLLPIVHRRLEALLGRTPATLDDPKLVVVTGALSVPHLAPRAPSDPADPPDPSDALSPSAYRGPATDRPGHGHRPDGVRPPAATPHPTREPYRGSGPSRPSTAATSQAPQPPHGNRREPYRGSGPPTSRSPHPGPSRPGPSHPATTTPPHRSGPPPAPSPALRRLLAAQPGLGAALAQVPGLQAAVDNERDLLALLCAPGLLERLRQDPARTAPVLHSEVRVDGDPLGRDGTRLPWSLAFADHPALLAQVRDRDRRVRDRPTVHEALLLVRVLATTPRVADSRRHDLGRLLAMPGFRRTPHVPWVLHGAGRPGAMAQTVISPARPSPAYTDPSAARPWWGGAPLR